MSHSPTNQTTTDSWESRVQQASIYLGKTPEEVEDILEEFGINKNDSTALEMLANETITPFGDLRSLFCEQHGIAVPKLRMAMPYLRGPKESKASAASDPVIMQLKAKFGIDASIDDLDFENLLPYYDPSKPANKVTQILKEKYGDQKIIAFKPDSKEIAREETVNYVTDLENGYEEEEYIEVEGTPVRLYAIGIVPHQKVDEDPMFPGYALKRDRSTMNKVNWKPIDKKTRQFCRIIVEEEYVNPRDRIGTRAFMELVLKGFDHLKVAFPEAYLKYQDRDAEENLPRLKISLVDTPKSQNPFGISGNRKW